ncbi:hybrid-cluster NAD(P)-dependent oxidoreductase [Shewanella avicenniae]|uniref:Hybrid-cluster NAD(P)-dependent oxidoreductase n=1 Tax=Shewanella avicenniae TaxID=2814294 RepID=A0ABX7QTB6_9GAMM|nr:hybrid-cluster NAD(P)-dependent oxidoreductase [Shewanella avicenniae]QSX34727.1 hybrid-cluster NAD(P)-dependent oxidoreductase [Shewanella avicenniae]
MTSNPDSVSVTEHLHAPTWQQGELRLICEARWQETHDVVSFRFRAPEPLKFIFKPGQFVTFHLEIADEMFHRSYTISSSPSRPHSLMVTIKRVAGGRVSNYLIDHLKPGHSIRASGPFGAFNIGDLPAERYLLLSAGCGVTPMYSMSRFLTDTLGANADIAFIHSASSVNDVIFADSLNAMAQRYAGLKLNYLIQHVSDRSSLADNMQSRRFDAELLTELVPDYQQRTVFVCGPQRFMDAAREVFAFSGFDMSHYHSEDFAQAIQTTLPSSNGSYQLTAASESTTLSADKTLLDGLVALKLPIIAACRSGVCGSCKCKVVQGEVASSSTQTLTEDEIAEGMVLACSSYAQSDVHIALAPF